MRGHYCGGTICQCGSNAVVWQSWNEGYTTLRTNTASVTAGAAVWRVWNDQYTTANFKITGGTTVLPSAVHFVTNQQIWHAWNTAAVQSSGYLRVEAAPETPEQREGRLVREAAAQRQYAEQAARQAEQNARIEGEKQIAERRAKKLLIECLSEVQRQTLAKHGYFDVKLPDGRLFRVTKGRSHNVKRLDEQGRERETYCAHVRDLVPDYDNMLAQKLWLEHDPTDFFRLANRGRDPIQA